MPELPEVETTLRGISPALSGQRVEQIIVRNPALRVPVSERITLARGRTIRSLRRRAKYLLIEMGGDTGPPGGLMIHLGMSGSLRLCPPELEARKHDHVDLILASGTCLRFNDPRRFGIFNWWDDPLDEHPLLRNLGPEPLEAVFSGDYLYRASRGLRVAVKNHIMNSRVVVGVGNIYASEALHRAGIHPTRAAGRISADRCGRLASAIRDVLERAIERGGTTLRDFTRPDAQPGYFAQDLLVYDRGGQRCYRCPGTVRRKVIGQRSTYYCPQCQH